MMLNGYDQLLSGRWVLMTCLDSTIPVHLNITGHTVQMEVMFEHAHLLVLEKECKAWNYTLNVD